MSHGHLSDPAVQDALRARERRMHATLQGDWESLLKTPWGRRLAYHLIFERGRAMALSFEPAIKDGQCAALHAARNEGIRELAVALAGDLQDEFPDLWLQMQAEAIAQRQAERAVRTNAMASVAKDED